MNESQKDNKFYHFIQINRVFKFEWQAKKVKNDFIINRLSHASKNLTKNRGEPDFIYLNENQKLLILLENKDNISLHEGEENKDNIKKYAINGIKHYLSFFINLNGEHKEYFKDWKILGIALSGDIEHKLNHKITTFVIRNDKIENINKNEILDEEDYINLFENYDIEEITSKIAIISKDINNLLRNIDSQKRPILLSALMISLYSKENDFYKNFISYKPNTIINNINSTVEETLRNEKIEQNKITTFLNQLHFIKDDKDLLDDKLNILQKILSNLKNNVIPLFSTGTHYDIIGKFYADFLRYAGVADVKKGIILTPYHISQLFTEIIDLKTNDVIFDPCCGTGAFLIAGMNAILKKIDDSEMNNKKEAKDKLKERQLIGIEKNATMYCLALSNMLFRGDGKSRIYNDDFFKINETIFEDCKPTIGFINPPYGGEDNEKKNPTKKRDSIFTEIIRNMQ